MFAYGGFVVACVVSCMGADGCVWCDRHDRDKAWAWHALFNDGSKATMDGFVKYYVETTQKMIKEWSYTIPNVPGTRVDIVRNVINLVSVHWVADYLVSVPYVHGRAEVADVLECAVRDRYQDEGEPAGDVH